MKFINITLQILLLVIFTGGLRAEAGESVSEHFISLALQGDLSRAKSLFDAIGPDGAPESLRELSDRFDARFVAQSESLSPGTGDRFADSVVSAYRKYWILTLMRHLSFREGEEFLKSSLNQALAAYGTGDSSTHSLSVYQRVGEVLDAKGFHYLDTPAPPLLDLFLWKTEEIGNYVVRLTDRTREVRVTFMEDLYSMGWKQYATLGLVSTTGWVEDGLLYCLGQAYDRNSENFRVSYLKHESRHLADLEDFPSLQSADLEYRAKLTELIFASASLERLLNDFTDKSAPNPASPHAWANYRVTREIYLGLYGEPLPDTGDPWRDVSTHSVNAAARDLLQRNTELLNAGS